MKFIETTETTSRIFVEFDDGERIELDYPDDDAVTTEEEYEVGASPALIGEAKAELDFEVRYTTDRLDELSQGTKVQTILGMIMGGGVGEMLAVSHELNSFGSVSLGATIGALALGGAAKLMGMDDAKRAKYELEKTRKHLEEANNTLQEN